MSVLTCAACKHWRNDKEHFPNGRCRRYPPTHLLVPHIAQGQIAGFSEISEWPSIQPSHSCGEWTAKIVRPDE